VSNRNQIDQAEPFPVAECEQLKASKRFASQQSAGVGFAASKSAPLTIESVVLF
jgi:hypothetical protein